MGVNQERHLWGTYCCFCWILNYWESYKNINADQLTGRVQKRFKSIWRMALQFCHSDYILFYTYYNHMVKPMKRFGIYLNMGKLQQNRHVATFSYYLFGLVYIYLFIYCPDSSFLGGWLANFWERRGSLSTRKSWKDRCHLRYHFLCWRKIKQDGNFHWIEIFKSIPAVTMWSASTVSGTSVKHIWQKYFRGVGRKRTFCVEIMFYFSMQNSLFSVGFFKSFVGRW